MKLVLLLSVVTMLTLSASDCNNKSNGKTYKGRLEIKGICSNYTISLLEGEMDTSKIVASWTDEVTNKTYQNVFALGSPCSFPSSIAEGETFSFTIDTAEQKDCVICMAYYPKPPKNIPIIVTGKK